MAAPHQALLAIGGTPPAASFAFLERQNSFSGTTTRTGNFTALGARTGKWIVTLMSGTATAEPTGVTLNGVALAPLVGGSGASSNISIWISDTDITTDGTDTLVGTWAASQSNTRADIFSVDSLLSTAAHATHAVDITSPADLDVNTVVDGLVFAACAAGNADTTWSGITERQDTASGLLRLSSAADQTPAASTPLAIQATNAGGIAGVSVSLR